MGADAVIGCSPDATVALKIADNVFCSGKKQGAIRQWAYLAILHGENMQDNHFRYDRNMGEYIKRHMRDEEASGESL